MLLRVGLDSARVLGTLRLSRREGSPIGTSTFRASICLLAAADKTKAAEWTGGAAARARARLRKSGERSTVGGRGSDPSIWTHSSTASSSSVFRQRRSEERRVGKECRSRWSPY